LLAAHAGHDVVAELGTGAAQLVDLRRKVGDLDGETVPAAGLRLGA
jgi:hypothetical protein